MLSQPVAKSPSAFVRGMKPGEAFARSFSLPQAPVLKRLWEGSSKSGCVAFANKDRSRCNDQTRAPSRSSSDAVGRPERVDVYVRCKDERRNTSPRPHGVNGQSSAAALPVSLVSRWSSSSSSSSRFPRRSREKFCLDIAICLVWKEEWYKRELGSPPPVYPLQRKISGSFCQRCQSEDSRVTAKRG